MKCAFHQCGAEFTPRGAYAQLYCTPRCRIRHTSWLNRRGGPFLSAVLRGDASAASRIIQNVREEMKK